MGHGTDEITSAGLRESDPGHPVAAVADDHLADLVQERGLIRRVHQDLIAVADGAQRAIDAAQLFVGTPALGDVLHLRHEVARLIALVPDHRGVQLNPHHAAIFVKVPLDRPVDVDLAIQQSRHRAHVVGAVVGVGQRLECRREQLLTGVAHNRAQRGVDFQEPRLGGDERHPDRRVVHRRPEALLAFPQRILGLPANGRLAVDRRRDGGEMTEQVRDLVGPFGARHRLLLDRLSGREAGHRAVQTFDPAGDEDVQRDAETEDGHEDAEHRDAELLSQAETVDRLGEAQIVDEHDQRPAIEAQIARAERQRGRHDDRQVIAIGRELRDHTPRLARLLHGRGDARLLLRRKAECRQIERTTRPVAAAAQDDHVLGRHEDRRAEFLEHRQLAELTLSRLQLVALRGALRPTLDLGRAQQLRALERLFESRFLHAVGDDVQHEGDRRAVQHQKQREPEAKGAEVATRSERRHDRQPRQAL